MASADISALREQIRNMSTILKNLQEDKDALQRDAHSYDEKYSALRMEANILLAMDEVRWQEQERNQKQSSSSQDISSLNKTTFQEENLKLELTILNSELRSVLPKLEKEAIAKENLRSQREGFLHEQRSRRNGLKLKSHDAVNLEIEEKRSELSMLRARFDNQIRDLHAKHRSLLQIVASKRLQLTNIEEEYDYRDDKARRLSSSFLKEQSQFAYLVQEHTKLKDSLAPFHSGRGWQVEAFLGYTGSMLECIPIDAVPVLFDEWMFISEPQDQPVRALLDDTLEKLGFVGKTELSCDEFVSVCDDIVQTAAHK